MAWFDVYAANSCRIAASPGESHDAACAKGDRVIGVIKPISASSNIGQPQAPLRAAPPDPRHLRHELTNQLTVINLCCGRIRAHLPQAEHTDNAAEFDQIEKAVEECVRILRQVEALDQPCVSVRNAHQKCPDVPSTTNGKIYPLFDSSEP